MVVTYKSASPQLFDQFWQLEQACHLSPWSESNLYNSLMGSYWGELMLVNGKAAGFYLFQQVLDELTLVNICISPAQRGNKLGTTLLTRGLEQAKARGGNLCFLEVRASNAAAIALYHSAGFIEYSKRTDYYPDPVNGGREDALLMSLQNIDSQSVN